MSLLLGVALLGLAVVGRYVLRSWLAPGAYFALYWSLAFVVPIVALPSDLVPVGALLWVALAVAAVGIGSVLPYRIATKESVTGWVPTGREVATLTRAMIVCSGIFDLRRLLNRHAVHDGSRVLGRPIRADL